MAHKNSSINIFTYFISSSFLSHLIQTYFQHNNPDDCGCVQIVYLMKYTNEYLINNPYTMIFHSLSNGPYNNRQTFRTHPEMREMCE